MNSMNQHNPLYKWVDATNSIADLPDNPLESALLYDLHIIEWYGHYSDAGNSLFQTYGHLQTQSMKKLYKTWDVQYFYEYVKNRNDVYEDLGFWLPDNSNIQSVLSQYEIQPIIEKVEQEVKKVVEPIIEKRHIEKRQEEKAILVQKTSTEHKLTVAIKKQQVELQNHTQPDIDIHISPAFIAGASITLALAVTYIMYKLKHDPVWAPIYSQNEEQYRQENIEAVKKVMKQKQDEIKTKEKAKAREKILKKYSFLRNWDEVFLEEDKAVNEYQLKTIVIGKYIETFVDLETLEVVHIISNPEWNRVSYSGGSWKIKKYKWQYIDYVEKVFRDNEKKLKVDAIQKKLRLDEFIKVTFKEQNKPGIQWYFKWVHGWNLKVVKTNNHSEYIPVLTIQECFSAHS